MRWVSARQGVLDVGLVGVPAGPRTPHGDVPYDRVFDLADGQWWQRTMHMVRSMTPAQRAEVLALIEAREAIELDERHSEWLQRRRYERAGCL